jgi:hypothetical protein
MIDLWHDYGTISCRTLLLLPDGVQDIKIWIVDGIVAIPDIDLSFRQSDAGCSRKSVIKLIRKKTHISISMAAALAASIDVMEYTVNREREHFDMTTNLAAIGHRSAYHCVDDDTLCDDIVPF